MTEPAPTESTPPDPQGKFLGVPYDWRRPTWDRVKSRWWNPDEPKFLTPKSFGWGYDFNLYRIFRRK
ncbi:hypothetical protein OHB26_09000 [Nocardia sp. NBC_01503]|uniref:hypothetical protein n=1 Tax=Nocardia sp. NBC_01503 TaxID=2975997 RepID=UPI002E7C503D|nr:hypothetical protein [Nocardia sp. NBC_01503]WTL34316.1 hypothetical protein OHB26_09000 [Nocardia sp. NBC_01503]